MIFKTGPINVQKVIPLSLETSKAMADKVIDGIGAAIALIPGKPHYKVSKDWIDEQDGSSKDLEAGHVVKASLSLKPLTDTTTVISVVVKGTVLMFARQDIEAKIKEVIDAIS